ncbi:MAG: DNA helicase Rep [Gammaproteobacteria bacterium]|nr:DNA helicase Rep [Gammaproteobacteria bacterium]MCW8988317.1 DNA helicase Rep [Gammaproteobacteria bacterium]
MKLNPQQHSAVKYIDGPCLVLAGAGSGKTGVITQKIAYLIEQCEIKPHNIAAVTFTNKSAREMQNRVAKLLGKDKSKGLRVSTFHTLGLDIIRKELDNLPYKKGFSIYDNQDSLALIKELMKRAFSDPDGQTDRILWQISRWKNAFVLPEQALQEANADAFLTVSAKVYEQYNHHLRTYNAVDFDDLIMIPVLLFRDHAEVKERWQNTIRYLLVDEYQDTNATQYELVKLIVGQRANLTVVGDDDQSVYSWRGAQPENLELLKDDFPMLNVIKLEQNYRSTGCILQAANSLIANNPHIFEKNLWSDLGFGQPIRVLRTRHEDDEAEQVVAELNHHQFVNRTPHKDYAILYRGNHQSRVFERMLRENNIPYYLSGGMSFFAYSEIKDIMSYLRLIANPDDDNAFLRIANVPRREIGPTSLEKLSNFSNKYGHSLFSSCFDQFLRESIGNRASANLSAFANWIKDYSLRCESESPVTVVKELIADIDYERWLTDTSKDEADANRRMDNVLELINWLERLAAKDSEADLATLVAKLTLLDTLDRDNEDNDENKVHLMTLHASKGLEFPHVYLVGVEEECLPHRNSIEEDNIEEERRLAYVGITRARKTLTISFASKRKRYGEVIECEPSRFLDELPQELLQWSGAGIELPEEEKKARGNASLAGLKSMLANS